MTGLLYNSNWVSSAMNPFPEDLDLRSLSAIAKPERWNKTRDKESNRMHC